MKKIVLASAAMGGAALVAFGASGTFAAFSDQATVANQAGAGTLYLTADSQAVSSGTSEVSALAPGDTATYTYYAENSGDMAGRLVATFRLLSDDENGCTAAETRGTNGFDDSCTNGADAGELAEVGVVTTQFGVVANRAACVAGGALTPFTPAPPSLRGLSGASTTQPIGAKQGFCAIVTVSLPSTANNTVQGDSATFAIEYTLAQVTS